MKGRPCRRAIRKENCDVRFVTGHRITSKPGLGHPARRRVKLAPVGIGVYFLVGGVAAHLLTQPQRKFDPSQTPTTRDLPYQDVQFPARNDGVPIAAWFIPTAADQPVVIMVHGRDASRTAAMAGHELDLAKALHDAGLNVLMLDLRGHGASGEGRFTFGIKERQDVLGAVDWLGTQGFAPEQMGMFGISLGAAASIGAMVAEPELGALAIDSGFADINTLIGEQWESASGLPRPFLTAALMVSRLLTGVDITQAKPVEEIASLAPRPLLLIHCAADDYVPAAQHRGVGCGCALGSGVVDSGRWVQTCRGLCRRAGGVCGPGGGVFWASLR